MLILCGRCDEKRDLKWMTQWAMSIRAVNMAAVEMWFVFLFRSKYRRKFATERICLCIKVILTFFLLNFFLTVILLGTKALESTGNDPDRTLENISQKLSELTPTNRCFNGLWKNGTCICSHGWTGVTCNHCVGRVRWAWNTFISLPLAVRP